VSINGLELAGISHNGDDLHLDLTVELIRQAATTGASVFDAERAAHLVTSYAATNPLGFANQLSDLIKNGRN
jgi:hypothetical protein